LLLVKFEKIAEMGISIEDTSRMTWHDKQFQIGPVFALKMREAAIGFCEQEENLGHRCILIENDSTLTIWTQKNNLQKSLESQLNSQKFIKRCHQELKKCIGPMATLVIDELVNGSEKLTANKLVERIVKQIPDPKLADEFIRSMKKK
jgi:hypothetical protein